jgi:hypothetical protein
MTNAIMKWLVVLCLLIIIAQPVSAKHYFINVHIVNDGMNHNAFVNVWDGSILIDSGPANSDGVRSVDLAEGHFYHITASGDNRYGEFNSIAPANDDNIDIYTS